MPLSIDDVERDFRLDIYDRMLRDPAIAGAIKALKTGVLSEGLRFVNRCQMPSPFKPDPEQQAKYDKAEEIRQFIERNFDRLQQPIEDILNEMLDYLAYGHKLAEKVYTLDEGGLVALKTLRVKPRNAYAFALSGTMDFLGVVAAKPGMGSALGIGQEVKPDEIIDRRKLFVLTHDSQGGDPRGQSALRPAYNAWFLKQQTWPAYLKWLIQFGTPSVKGTLPPGVTAIDGNGEEGALTAAEAMAEKLVAFSNGTAIVVENGASVDLIESKGDGAGFQNAIDLFDRQMKEAVIIAVRATAEAEHGSKADSQTAQDVLGQAVQGIRRRVEMGFYRDVCQPLVEMNWGPDAAQELCPFLSLSDLDPGDVVERGMMIARLKEVGLLHPSQDAGIDEILHIPPRDYEAQQAELDSQDATNAEVLKRGESASIETRILMLHPDWTPAQVEAEKQLILDESGMNVPDPTQLLTGWDRVAPENGALNPDGTPIEKAVETPFDKAAAEKALA
jgi:hypothetical protein